MLEKLVVVLGTACVTMLLILPFSLLYGYILMLAMGAAHGLWAGVPAAGYGTSVLLAMAWNAFVSPIVARGGKSA